MNRDDEPAIEVEVIAIDGAAPPPKTDAADGIYPDDGPPGGQAWTHWQSWPSQARNLHPLWWPVIIVAGGILLVVFLTAGLLLGVLFVIYRIVRDLLRVLFG
jgi:hypothetical protein